MLAVRTPRPALLVFLLGLVVAGLSGCGRDDRITVTPNTHDFGNVRQGEMPTKTFTVTNGTSRVVSVMPQPNCSCFAVPSGRNLKSLDPGASIEVTVMFDSTAKPPGPVQGKYVTFNFDHPTQSKIVVPLEGHIYKVFDLRPDKLQLGRIDGSPRAFAARTITVQPEPGYRVRIAKAVVTPDVFDLATEDAQRGATDVQVSLKRDLRPRPLGAFRAALRLEIEITGPGGATFQQRRQVEILGSWALKPDGTPIR